MIGATRAKGMASSERTVVGPTPANRAASTNTVPSRRNTGMAEGLDIREGSARWNATAGPGVWWSARKVAARRDRGQLRTLYTGFAAAWERIPAELHFTCVLRPNGSS